MEKQSREQELEQSLRRLLNTTELNLDEIEDENREAIQEALRLLRPVEDRR